MEEDSTGDSTVPVQRRGYKTNVEHTLFAPSVKEAERIFQDAVARMLDVNRWQAITNSVLSNFQITDKAGKEMLRLVQVGDFFRIDVPGPENGYDWVQVEMLQFKPSRVAMRVRPAGSPLHPHEGTAHFFKGNATSTFQIFRRGRIVTASVNGRNEIPNVKSESIEDNVRNAVMATGAIAGASKNQWRNLVEGFLRVNKP